MAGSTFLFVIRPVVRFEVMVLVLLVPEGTTAFEVVVSTTSFSVGALDFARLFFVVDFAMVPRSNCKFRNDVMCRCCRLLSVKKVKKFGGGCSNTYTGQTQNITVRVLLERRTKHNNVYII